MCFCSRFAAALCGVEGRVIKSAKDAELSLGTFATTTGISEHEKFSKKTRQKHIKLKRNANMERKKKLLVGGSNP